MVRQRMVRLRHADLRIGPRALFLAEHERDHARQIGLKRQHLQIQHQRQMIFEDRRRALRLLHRRQFDIALFLGLLDAAFDVANRVRIFVDLDLILRPQFRLQVRQLLGHRVQNALVLLQSALRARARSVLPLSPNSFSNTARGFHSIGSGCVGLRQESVCV